MVKRAKSGVELKDIDNQYITCDGPPLAARCTKNSLGYISTEKIVNCSIFVVSNVLRYEHVREVQKQQRIREAVIIEESVESDGFVKYVAVAITNFNDIFVFRELPQQNLNHFFVNLRNVCQNIQYQEREDEFDEIPYFPRQRLVDIANQNCQRLFGFVETQIDEDYADSRSKAVESYDFTTDYLK